MLLLEICFRVAGTTGAILTSPLEVVKTRFQSSNSILKLKESAYKPSNKPLLVTGNINGISNASNKSAHELDSNKLANQKASSSYGPASNSVKNYVSLTNTTATNTAHSHHLNASFNSNVLFKNNNLNVITNNAASHCSNKNNPLSNFRYSLFKKIQIHTLQLRSSGGGGGGGGVGGSSLGTTIYYNLK